MYRRPTKILVPLDGSDLAATAIVYAAMLAAATDGRLILFTAVGGDERTALEDFATHEGITLDQAADAHLSRMATTISDDIPAELVHTYSPTPATSIVDYANDHDISLIVMASHGHSGVSRWLLGSIADKVVQTSPIPITIVPVRP